ncbi:MAG: DNA-directed RNA polymerase subunit alpha, partial [Desulfosarcina sp.]|nr:DNA-directed RNA polymerase subunit alpha [Desulfobacterales bacterium]
AEVCIKAGTEGVLLAGEILSDDVSCEDLNPDQYIATLFENALLLMSMVVKLGKRYALSEENKDDDAPEGTIPIDAIFSPIKKVSYTVSEARIGQKSDYDKLTLEVWTDGSISPEDSVAYAAKILKEQMSVFINFDESIEPVIEKEVNVPVQPEINKNLYRRVDELELSVRSANCLKNADINKIHQLVNKSESEMLKTKNFGRKSLNEIKEVLNEMGLFLGMTLDGFVLPEEDMEEGE